MKKKEIAALIVGVIILCICVSAVSFTTGRIVEMGDIYDDGWVHVKTMKILSIPHWIEDGNQLDWILVDQFVIENGIVTADGAYGFLTVNETTGKIQFFIIEKIFDELG